MDEQPEEEFYELTVDEVTYRISKRETEAIADRILRSHDGDAFKAINATFQQHPAVEFEVEVDHDPDMLG